MSRDRMESSVKNGGLLCIVALCTETECPRPWGLLGGDGCKAVEILLKKLGECCSSGHRPEA